MSDPQVFVAAAGAPFEFREGCRITELWNHAADAAVSVAHASVPAGGVTRWHRLAATTERYVILSGAGVVHVGALRQAVGAGDVVVIPPDVAQCIHNTGVVALEFLALCTPRFVEACYTDLGEGGTEDAF